MMSQFADTQLASLSPEALAKVQDLEQKLGGICVVAYQKPIAPAPLSDQQVKMLQQAEKDIGACLVAYRLA